MDGFWKGVAVTCVGGFLLWCFTHTVEREQALADRTQDATPGIELAKLRYDGGTDILLTLTNPSTQKASIIYGAVVRFTDPQTLDAIAAVDPRDRGQAMTSFYAPESVGAAIPEHEVQLGPGEWKDDGSYEIEMPLSVYVPPNEPTNLRLRLTSTFWGRLPFDVWLTAELVIIHDNDHRFRKEVYVPHPGRPVPLGGL